MEASETRVSPAAMLPHLHSTLPRAHTDTQNRLSNSKVVVSYLPFGRLLATNLVHCVSNREGQNVVIRVSVRTHIGLMLIAILPMLFPILAVSVE